MNYPVQHFYNPNVDYMCQVENMKIIDEPQFGPMFRFNDANVYL